MAMRLRAAMAAFAILIGAAGPAGAQDAAATAARMHRGVNVLGYDPLWRDPAKARFHAGDFGVIRRGGFDFVRVVLQSFDHMDAANRLDPQWLATLDRMVAAARAAGLTVILDEHDFDKCSTDLDACAPKLTAFWTQVARRYAGEPGDVLFELLNEPHGGIDAARWNAMLAQLIPLVRQTNPTRTLVVGPVQWNSLKQLPTLTLPAADRNILVTFHYYEPFRFTHQGASWAAGVKDLRGIPFTPADEVQVGRDLDVAAAWAKANGRPVLLGEFGAYDGSGTPIEARARYATVVRRAAEARNIPWAWWQFDSNFIVYDLDRHQWVEPIHTALTSAP